MGKVQVCCRLLIIFLTATAFFLSGIACMAADERINRSICLLAIFAHLTFVFLIFILFRKEMVQICCTIPTEWLRERIQSRNQPNQPQGNNQAGDQNNDQQDGDINTPQNEET
ncbi:Hypothetical predicted protein [Cloeon dipterum]|uniref:Uncharacterized protein n=1 Tax=Cloeon dipterum TaxID=197152 RepID=A0A8S1DVA5_9INSE|nr:Hypothetical predicted protein [Cloeon dipterum]